MKPWLDLSLASIMKVCLFSWNPSDSLPFASHCLSPLLLVYLFINPLKRGEKEEIFFVVGAGRWSWIQRAPLGCVIDWAALSTEQNLCFPCYMNSLGWQTPLPLNPLVFAPAKAAFGLEAKVGFYQQKRGDVSLLRTSLCPCSATVDLALPCTSARWWQTPEALADEQTHPSLCVFDLWLPF